MSKAKKILTLFCLFALMFAFAGCDGSGLKTEEGVKKGEAEEMVELASGLLEFESKDLLNWTKDFEFITENAMAPNVTYSWEIVKVTNEAGEEIPNIYLAEDGKLTLPVYGTGKVQITVKCTLACEYDHTDAGSYKVGTVTDEKEWTLIVPEAAEVKTVKKTIDAFAELGASFEDLSDFSFENVIVTAMLFDKSAFVVSDGTAGLYIYQKGEDLEIGDKINISGKMTTYYSIFEGKNCNYTKISSGNPLPAPTEISVSEMNKNIYTEKASDNSVKHTGSYQFKIYGKIVTEGSNYYIEDAFTGERAIFYYKSAFTQIPGFETASQYYDVLTPFVGEYVNVVVAYYDYNSSYLNHRLLFTNVAPELAGEPTLTDAQKIQVAKASLASIAGEYKEGATIVLPATHENGTAISWSCDSTILDVATGLVGAVSSNKKATLTATLTCGDASDTLDLEVTFMSLVQIAHKGTLEDPYSVQDMLLVMDGWTNKELSTEQYYVQGVVESATFNQHGSYEIYLESPSTTIKFELYQVKAAEGLADYSTDPSQLIGQTVVAYGYAKIYNSIYEITSYKDGEGVYQYPVLLSVGFEEPAPLTVEEAIVYIDNFAKGASAIGTEEITVSGVVKSSTYKSSYGSYDIYLEAGEKTFQLYSAVLADSITGDYTAANALVGATVVCKGYPQLFVKGEALTYEIAYLSASKSPTGEAVSPIISSVEFEPVEEVLSVEEAIAYIDNFAQGASAIGTEEITVSGVVKSSTYKSSYGSYDIYLEAGEKTFQLYSAVLAEGLTGDYTAADALVGATVVCKGYPQLFVKGEALTYEIAYLSASKSPTGEAVSPVISSVEFPVVEKVLTVEEAIAYIDNFAQGASAIGTEEITVTGVVKSSTYKESYGSYDLYLEAGEKTFQLYSAVLADGITGDFTAADAFVGTTVVCKGYPQLFVKGEALTYEIAYLSATKSPTGAAVSPVISSVTGEIHQKTDAEKVAEAKAALTIAQSVVGEGTLVLPATQGEATISWATSNAEALTAAGVAGAVTEETTVTMTATLTVGDATDTKEFSVTVTVKKSSEPKFSTDFGTAQHTGYAAERKTFTDLPNVTTFATQIAYGQTEGKYNYNNVSAVLWSSNSKYDAGYAYVEFAVSGATSITFDAAFWPGDEKGSSNVTGFGVAYSVDGVKWTELEIGVGSLSGAQYTSFTKTFESANYVRVYENTGSYSSSTKLRICVDNVQIF